VWGGKGKGKREGRGGAPLQTLPSALPYKKQEKEKKKGKRKKETVATPQPTIYSRGGGISLSIYPQKGRERGEGKRGEGRKEGVGNGVASSTLLA